MESAAALAALIWAGWASQLHRFDGGWCLLVLNGREIRHVGVAADLDVAKVHQVVAVVYVGDPE